MDGADALLSALSLGKIPWPLVAVAAAAAVILIFLGKAANRRLREKPGADRPGLP